MRRRDSLRTSLNLACVFWAVLFLMATVDVFIASSTTVDENFGWILIYRLAQVVITPLLALVWFTADAEEQNHHPSTLFRVFVLLLGALAIPIYLLRVKGVKRTLLSFGMFGFMLAIYLIYSWMLTLVI